MTRKAVVKNGIVENIISWGPDWVPPEGATVIDSEDAMVGWFYDGNTFISPDSIQPTIFELKQYASEYRKRIESLPITHQRGNEVFVVKTDNTSLARIHRLYLMACNDKDTIFNWESNNNIFELTSKEVIEINKQVNEHMQNSYEKLKTVYSNIDSGLFTKYEYINNYPWL